MICLFKLPQERCGSATILEPVLARASVSFCKVETSWWNSKISSREISFLPGWCLFFPLAWDSREIFISLGPLFQQSDRLRDNWEFLFGISSFLPGWLHLYGCHYEEWTWSMRSEGNHKEWLLEIWWLRKAFKQLTFCSYSLRLWQRLGSGTDSPPWALSTCAPVSPPCAISVLSGAKQLQAGSMAVSVAPPLTCLCSFKSCLILELSLGDISFCCLIVYVRNPINRRQLQTQKWWWSDWFISY